MPKGGQGSFQATWSYAGLSFFSFGSMSGLLTVMFSFKRSMVLSREKEAFACSVYGVHSLTSKCAIRLGKNSKILVPADKY